MAMKKRWFASMLCAALLACGGDGDGGSVGGDSGGDNSAGSGDNASGGGGDSQCVATAGNAVVLPPENFSDGSVIYRMQADDTHLYFSTIDRLYRVPLGGGAAEELYFRELAIVIYFWLRDDDIVLMEGRRVLSMPKNGGATTELVELTDSPDASLDGRIAAELRGDMLYGKSRKGFDEDLVVTYFSADLTTGESRVLYQGKEGENSGIAVTDEHIYVVSVDESMVPPGDDLAVGVPDILYRVSLAEGGIEMVSVGDSPLQLGVVGADAQSVYLNTSEPMGVLDAGVARLPFDGGTPERVLDGSFLFGSILEHIPFASTSYLRALDEVFEVAATGSARKVGCVQDDAHSMAITDDHIFVAVFQEEGEKSAIVRLAR